MENKTYNPSDVWIIQAEYLDPQFSFLETQLDQFDAIAKCFISPRTGVGSLAECFRTGYLLAMMNLILEKSDQEVPKYIWFLTNVKANKMDLIQMIDAMDDTGYAAIHPTFDSDHSHLRINPDAHPWINPVPFVEFTCPIVRFDIFNKFQLDCQMPYWGHDIDWSYRVRQAGYELAVHNGVSVEHNYLRNNTAGHPLTEIRKQLRAYYDEPTRRALEKKYGPQWPELLSVPYIR